MAAVPDPEKTGTVDSSDNEKHPRSVEGDHAAAAASPDDTAIMMLELVKAQDQHHPMHWPTWKRWSIITFYCWMQVFVTLTSTTYVSAEYYIGNDFKGPDYSSQLVTLGQSMFIIGTAVGPAFMGPLS